MTGSIGDMLLRQAMTQEPIGGGVQQDQQDQQLNLDDYMKNLLLTPTDTVGGRIKSGLQSSVGGILTGQGLSLQDMKVRGVRDPNFVMDAIEGVATVLGDIPGIFAGTILGTPGGVIGEAAGAFAVPVGRPH